MVLYATTITNRLRYISSFIGTTILGSPFNLTSDKDEFANSEGIKLNYSNEEVVGSTFTIIPHSLLFETGIHEQNPVCFIVHDKKAFFETNGDWPFDIFAACFYLLSRYEEYLPHRKDSFGRYAHENSLAFRNQFLNLPLINLWLKDFKEILKKTIQLTIRDAHPLNTHHSPLAFLPTYDIDEAYSFKHKQWWRTKAGAVKDLVTRNGSRYQLRKKVLAGKKPDPFDAYEWMDRLHKKYVLHPHYFFLLAGKTSRYDRNILPTETAMRELIVHHANQYSVGIHPSWQSFGNSKLIRSEIKSLETISGQKVISSRQHFIRFEMPATFRTIIGAGILKDFSMGYGSINGFRASVASSFYWYDLEKEAATPLMLYPFCFMDANCFFEQKQTPTEALEEMRFYYKQVKQVNGMLCMIWHNTFLGTDPLFSGWREVYEQFIGEIQGSL